MGRILKRIEHGIEKKDIKNRYGRTPKSKCPICKRSTLFKKEYNKGSKMNVIKCIQCGMIVKTED